MANRRPHRPGDPNCDCNTCLLDAYGYDWRDLVPGTGWLRDYVNYALEVTDAPPIYHIGSGLACLATVVGANCVFTPAAEARPVPLNLWVLTAGTSAKQRKSTAVSMVEDVLTENFAHLMTPWQGSPEAIFSEIAAQPQCIMVIPEFPAFLAQMNKKYAQDMKTILMHLYDGKNTSVRVTRGKGKEIVEEPRVSMIGGAALDLLDQYLKNIDFRSGFLSRMMFIAGDRKKLMLQEKFYPTELKRLQDDLFDIARWAAQQKTITASKDGNDALGKFTTYLDGYLNNVDTGYQSLIGRTDPLAKKIAALFAASMRNPSVYQSIVEERVIPLANHSINVIENYLIHMMADSEWVRAADRLKRLIKEKEYTVDTWIEFRELVTRSKDVKYATAAVEQLVAEDIVTPIVSKKLNGDTRAKKRVMLLRTDF